MQQVGKKDRLRKSRIELLVGSFQLKDIPSDSQFKVLSRHGGELSRVIIISNGKDEFALRIKKKPFPKNNLIFEKNFVDALGSMQLSVTIPKIYTTVSRQPFLEDSKNFYTLMSRVPGEPRFDAWHESHLFTEKDIEQGFKLLGLLHNTYREVSIENTKESPSVPELLDNFQKKFKKVYLLKGKFSDTLQKEKDFLDEKINQLREELKNEGYEKLTLFPVHYDMNYTNVLWEGKKIVSLIDFDWAQFSTLEFDFAQMCKLTCGSFSVSGNSNLFDNGKLRIAIDAYNKTAQKKIKNKKIIRTLLDVSSLFIAHWALDSFITKREKEKYFLSIFQAGIDRLKQKIIL